MQHQAMRILVAIANECRYELHECNVLLREMKEMDKQNISRDSEEYQICNRCYLSAQNRYVVLLMLLRQRSEPSGEPDMKRDKYRVECYVGFPKGRPVMVDVSSKNALCAKNTGASKIKKNHPKERVFRKSARVFVYMNYQFIEIPND